MDYEKLRRALEAGLFDPELCEIVPPPAEVEITKAEADSGLQFSAEHHALLREWGGSDFHEILIHAPAQVREAEGMIEFGADYSGSLFRYDSEGAVHADDAQSGETVYLCASLPEFINDFLLGARGEDFYGEDWVAELRALGLADAPH